MQKSCQNYSEVLKKFKNSSLDKILLPWANPRIIYIKRDDLLDPQISGNKGRKLVGFVHEMVKDGKKGILTYGGAYSNHLLAVASLGQRLNIPTIGVVRGHELNAESNCLLSRASDFGMQLYFMERAQYRIYSQSSEWPMSMIALETSFLVIPEGGRGALGQKGCISIGLEVIANLNTARPIHFFVAAGTGTSALGLAQSLRPQDKLYVVSALKGDFMREEILAQLDEANKSQVSVILDAHEGGYAKYNQRLVDFINHFYKATKIPLEPIYEAKMMLSMQAQLLKGIIPPDEPVVVIHAGGLQGIEGFNERFGTQILL